MSIEIFIRKIKEDISTVDVPTSFELHQDILSVQRNLILYPYNRIGAFYDCADNCRFSADGIFEDGAEFFI